MKNILTVLFIAIVAVSCSKDFLKEDPRGQLTIQGFGKNEAELNIAVTALYNSFTTIGYGEYLTGLDATFKTNMKTPDGINLTWEQTVQKHPYYNKMTYANGSNPINYYDNYQDPYYFSFSSNRTTVLMRFAEVKLIYAEAKAMSASPDATAYQQINDVRMRAGLPNLIAGLSQSAFRDSVVAERAWEFAGPENGQRWFDLVRLEMVESANSNRHANELPLQRAPSKQDYFAPIPFKEKLLNPTL